MYYVADFLRKIFNIILKLSMKVYMFISRNAKGYSSHYDRLKCCEDIDSMVPGEIFSTERSLLLFWRKLPDSYTSCNGENFIVSKRVAFRLLALAFTYPVKTEITIAYPERNIMECSLVVIVFSVNAGKVIDTRGEVVEAVSLMLFKFLIVCVHPEASWNHS